MTKELEKAIRHIKTRADGWAIKAITDALEQTETWNGYHGQINAPKGTFKKIWDDCKQEPSDEWQNGYDTAWEEAKVFYEVEPCEDAISREAVMGLVAREHSEWDDLYIDIAKLPSITPSKEWVRNIHDKEICPYCGKERWSRDESKG